MSNPLASLGRKSYVSLNGLETLLAELRDIGHIPETSSRRTIKRARDSETRGETSMGAIFQSLTVNIQDKEGRLKEHVLPMVYLPALLAHCLASLQGFRDFFVGKLLETPSSLHAPWRILLYGDEITPGNALKPVNSRKLHAIYLSFAEFGDKVHAEQYWFTILVARSDIVNKIPGGLSELFKLMLQAMQKPPFDLSQGCMLDLGQGQHHMFFAETSVLVADESCLKYVWDVKGASGSVPCMFCANVVAHNTRLDTWDASGTLVTISEWDRRKFQLRSSNALWDAHDLLDRRSLTLNKGEFAKLQQSMGLNHCPTGLLASRILPACKVTMFDWMHIFLVSGLMQLQVNLTMPYLYSDCTHADIVNFLASFAWPHGLRAQRKEVLETMEKKIASDFKCSASQGLSLYPLLRLFILCKAQNGELSAATMPAARCFLDLCRVLDLLHECNKGRAIRHDELATALEKHAKSFLAVHGAEACIPKFHFALHLPWMLQQHKVLYSCFCHERKHREIKMIANNIHKVTPTFERTILEDVWGRAFLGMKEPHAFEFPCLNGPKPAGTQLLAEITRVFGSAEGAQASTVCRFEPGQTCERGDIVLCSGGHVAEVWLHVQPKGKQLHSLVAPWIALGQNRFQVCKHPESMPASTACRQYGIGCAVKKSACEQAALQCDV